MHTCIYVGTTYLRARRMIRAYAHLDSGWDLACLVRVLFCRVLLYRTSYCSLFEELLSQHSHMLTILTLWKHLPHCTKWESRNFCLWPPTYKYTTLYVTDPLTQSTRTGVVNKRLKCSFLSCKGYPNNVSE